MAQININELIKIIKEHPNYSSKWDNGVSPNQALYISFHTNTATGLSSDSITTKDGHELIIDKDSKGVVFGIEII